MEFIKVCLGKFGFLLVGKDFDLKELLVVIILFDLEDL